MIHMIHMIHMISMWSVWSMQDPHHAGPTPFIVHQEHRYHVYAKRRRADCGGRAVGSGQWAVGSGQWAVGRCGESRLSGW
jgi:hypothetical protein